MIGRKYGLYDRTLFQTEVHELHWIDDSATWSVKTSRGDDIQARFVIPAAGPLHRPKLPGVKGIEEYAATVSTPLAGTIIILEVTAPETSTSCYTKV